jgi:hypothetical protein
MIIALWVAACALLLHVISALAAEPANFVGADACGGCHAAETALWRTSHHGLAMQKATPATVLGNFADTRFEHFGVTTSFLSSSTAASLPISTK